MRYVLALLALILNPAGALADPARASPVVPSPLPPAADRSVVACRDFRNRTVRTVEVQALGDAGRAEFVAGAPVIMLDPVLMGGLPANLQVFFKLHECGHHVLGHLFAPTTESEKEADCWAIKQERKHGLTHDDIVAWKPHFAASKGSRFGHLPGPQRVEFLLACLDSEG
ncbi:MAG: hypothetical protein ABL901_02365 [Hyphomicrobiaceae bacterium]